MDLRFKDHRIIAGKPSLSGLPSTWIEHESEAQTLIIGLEDSKLGLRVELSYTAFADHSVSRDRHAFSIAESLLSLLRRHCLVQSTFRRATRLEFPASFRRACSRTRSLLHAVFVRASNRSKAVVAPAAIITIPFSR